MFRNSITHNALCEHESEYWKKQLSDGLFYKHNIQMIVMKYSVKLVL